MILRISFIIAALLLLVSCARQKADNDPYDPRSPEYKAQVDSVTNLIENRPKYRHLNTAIIDSTPDLMLSFLIIEHIQRKVEDGAGRNIMAVMNLPKPQKAVYLTWWFGAEVLDGGLIQYYSNTNSQLIEQLPDALKSLGALQMAGFIDSTNAVYREKKRAIESQKMTEEGGYDLYDYDPFRKFNSRYYDVWDGENVEQLMINYIRKNKHAFAGL